MSSSITSKRNEWTQSSPKRRRKQSRGRGLRKLLACIMALSLVLSGLSLPTSQAFAEETGGTQGTAIEPLSTAPAPYAWSKTQQATTGDFFADTYNGVGTGSVFEDTTVDRLADVLSAAGDYYIVFANPKSAAGQKSLAAINAKAKANGITKIYHFNPVVDNQRLDITSTDPAIRDITNSNWTSTGIAGVKDGANWGTIPHSIGGIWTYIKSFLPVYYTANGTSQDEATKALFDNYTSDKTLLFRFHKDNHTDLPANATIGATYLYDGTGAVETSGITPVFKNGDNVVASNARSEYQFIKRGFAATGANPAIADADFANGSTFTGNTITFEEAFNLLNSPGEHSFYFFAFGCGDTKALVAKALKAARDNDVPLYLVDGSLGGSVRFKSGSDINALSSSTSNAWLNIRLGNNASATSAQKNLSYIYGELVNGYFGTGFITENYFAKATSNIQYYINGDIGNSDALTNGHRQDGATRPYAPRFQYPILLTHNKDYTEPVTLDTTAIQVTPKDAAGHVGSPVTAVKEYMSSVASADTVNFGNPSTYPDRYIPYANATNATFLAASRATQTSAPTPTDFTTKPKPGITGEAKVGQALTADAGTWNPAATSLIYKWYADGVYIWGANTKTYTPTAADEGKAITVKVTALANGLNAATETSDATANVALPEFDTTPTPTITGTVEVGQVLTANEGTWNPAATFSYQWFAGGTAISGATSKAYKLQKVDEGKTITVKVTGKASGLIDATIESAPTVEVAPTIIPDGVLNGTEVDWFADVYDGLTYGHVFESVTWERLSYTLGYGAISSANDAPYVEPITDSTRDLNTTGYPGGNFAIVFGGPENASSQAALPYIDEAAKAYGIEKVYHFDPRLDGGLDGNQKYDDLSKSLDISNPDLPWANAKNLWTGKNFSILNRLGTSDIFPALYDSSSTYLFIYNKADANPIVADIIVRASDVATFDGNAYKAAIGDIFDSAKPISTYSHIDYYQSRVNNVAATKAAGLGITESSKADFAVQNVTYPEIVHIFKSEGDYAILFGGTWCPYTGPSIEPANTAAKANGVKKIYMFDFQLSGASSGNAVYIRQNASNSFGFNYLYSDLIADFLTNLELEPSDNGAKAKFDYIPHNTGTETKQALTIGVPFHFEYNKDNKVVENGVAAPGPVVSEWIGYAPFKDKLFAYAWFNANTLRIFYDNNDARILGRTGSGTGVGAAVTGLGRHIDPDFDNVISDSNVNNGVTSATLAIPAFKEFFAGIAENRAGKVNAWDTKPEVNPTDSSEPSETGGCGTGSNPIDTSEEGTILGQNGDSAYDVSNYDIQLNYAKPIGSTVKAGYRAKTTITAKALVNLNAFSFDLADLNVRKVTVNGADATFTKVNNNTTDTHKLVITPTNQISKNANFTVIVDYYSYTDSYQFGAGTTQGFVASNNSQGATAIGEPNGSLYWFPSNNNTTDRATYDVKLTAPRDLVGVSAGVLKEKVVHGTTVTRHWQQATPTLPYLEFASFGNYVEFENEITLSDGNKIPSYSYVDKTLYNASQIGKANAYAYAEKLQDYVQWAESKFGKYPEKSVGFVFENLDDVTYNLETVTRPIYNGIPDKGVFVHELLHQWFGNSVAIADWKDLWLNEGFAVYLTNVYYAEQTNTVPNGDLEALYASWFAAQNDDLFWGLAPADPKNSYNLFGNGTYGRGSYALASLRAYIGDAEFFALLKAWATDNAGKSVTTEDFIAATKQISAKSDADLDAFFNNWLYGTEKPASFETQDAQDLEFTTAPDPTITGVAEIGKTLTANTGTWAPTPTSFTYQWYSNGSPIDGAIGATYVTVDPDDICAPIYVEVTAHLDGYVSTTKASAETDLIEPSVVDTAALETAIATAKAELASVKKSADGKDVDSGNKWISVADYEALSSAIQAAEYALTYGDQGVVDAAVTSLALARSTFASVEKKDGTKSDSESLSSNSLVNAKVTIKDQVYSGKALQPAPVVKLDGKTLKKGTDYTLVYASNKNIGKASITIKAAGEYKDSKKVTFKINPRAVKISKLKAGAKKLTVKWKKSKDSASGYQITYKTSSGKLKTVTIKNGKKVSKLIKKLKSGKKYSVKIRAYKTVKGEKYYSAYSKAKISKKVK